jgi:hypothetical protein
VEEHFPIQLTTAESNTNSYCYTTIYEPTGKVYSDQTGNFQYTSSKGNKALVILYDYDSNAILAEPIGNRKATTILEATKKMHNILQSKGHGPQHHILDNECSDLMKKYFKENNINHQLAPPGQHCTQRRRTSHPHIQKPFHCRTMQPRRRLSNTPMGPTNPTSRPHHQPTSGFTHQPKTLSIRTIIWALQLQQGTNSTIGHSSLGTFKTRSTQNMGSARKRRMVSWTSTGTLPMLSCIHDQNQSRTHFRHHIMVPHQNHHAKS